MKAEISNLKREYERMYIRYNDKPMVINIKLLYSTPQIVYNNCKILLTIRLNEQH